MMSALTECCWLLLCWASCCGRVKTDPNLDLAWCLTQLGPSSPHLRFGTILGSVNKTRDAAPAAAFSFSVGERPEICRCVGWIPATCCAQDQRRSVWPTFCRKGVKLLPGSDFREETGSVYFFGSCDDEWLGSGNFCLSDPCGPEILCVFWFCTGSAQ